MLVLPMSRLLTIEPRFLLCEGEKHWQHRLRGSAGMRFVPTRPTASFGNTHVLFQVPFLIRFAFSLITIWWFFGYRLPLCMKP